jgi:hypothetical protein
MENKCIYISIKTVKKIMKIINITLLNFVEIYLNFEADTFQWKVGELLQNTRRHIPNDHTFHSCCRNDLNSHKT